MTCTYTVVRGANHIAEPCGRQCDGDYCFDHKKLIDDADELDRELQKIISQRGVNLL